MGFNIINSAMAAIVISFFGLILSRLVEQQQIILQLCPINRVIVWHDCIGVMTFPKKYIGSFRLINRNGSGTNNFASCEHYDGDFKDCRPIVIWNTLELMTRCMLARSRLASPMVRERILRRLVKDTLARLWMACPVDKEPTHAQMLTNAKVNGKMTNATAWLFWHPIMLCGMLANGRTTYL